MNTSDASLKRMLLCCEGYRPILFIRHPRNYHGPIHVKHDIDSVRFVVEPNDSRATVTLNGSALPNGNASDSFPLATGKNVFHGAITAIDGRTQSTFHCKVFRAYPQPAWEPITRSAPWKPRDSAGELVFRNRMWMIGGFIPELTNDTWSSADGATWRRGGDVPTERGIDIPIAFVFDDRMWVADIDGQLFSSTDGESWSPAAADTPWRGRRNAGCVVFNDRVWVMGGSEDNSLLNDLWSSADGIHWVLEAEHAPWCARQITHTPVVLNGKIWLLGGGALGPDYYPFVAWNDVWSSSDGRHWERVLDHAPWVPRIWGSTAVYRNRMWLIAGFRSEPAWENLGDVWYSPDGRDWRQLDTVPAFRHSGSTGATFGLHDGVWAPGDHRETPTRLNEASFELHDSVWAPRHEQSVYAFDDSLWLAGGMIWPLMNDVWRIRLPGLCFLSQPVIEIYANSQYEYRAVADFNESAMPVRYRLRTAPDWLTIDEASGRVQGIAGQAGDVKVSIEAHAGRESVQQEYTLYVLDL